MKASSTRVRQLVALLLLMLCRVQVASAQAGFYVDTIMPHYARLDDELPALLSSMSSVLQSGLDDRQRAWLIGAIAARRPRQPLGRNEYGRPMTYLFATGFRERNVPLALRVYWRDTNTVAVGVRTPDKELAIAIATALLDARVAKLVSPATIRISIAEPEPYNGSEPGFSFTMSVPIAPHCRGFGVERRMRWQGDTLLVQVLGVPPRGWCPSMDMMRGSIVALYGEPGRHVIAFDSRGDTNLVTLVVTDTSFALVPQRTTYVSAEQTVKWRYPSASITLRCNRQAGDPHFCDALHEFINAQPGVRPYVFPSSGVDPLGPSFGQERTMTYRYADDATASKVRRCVASFPPQTRLDSWVRMFGRPSVGRWWAEAPSGTSNWRRNTPAEALDASGDVPSSCGDAGSVVDGGRPAAANERGPVHTTHVTTFAFKQTNRTTISARSDGWIVMTPLTGLMGSVDTTTHLYARAVDAQRWVQRVRDVLSARSIDRYTSEAGRFIPQLGRGRVNVVTRVTDSVGYPKVSFGLQDCSGVHRGYDVDGAALLRIAEDVERAALIALRGSAIPVPPTLEQPYESNELTCAAAPLDDSTRRRHAALQQSTKVFSLQFVVDTGGRVEKRSIEVAPGTDDAYAETLREDVARWRYRPAEWAGIPVRQVVHLRSARSSP